MDMTGQLKRTSSNRCLMQFNYNTVLVLEEDQIIEVVIVTLAKLT